MPDVFISYPHDEKSDAALFASALKNKGLSTWVAEADLPAGADWKGQIDNALTSAGAIVFFVYKHQEPSKWMEWEYMRALESYWSGKARILVPLLMGSNVEPPVFLKQWRSLRVENKSDLERAATRLVKWVQSDQPMRSEPSRKDKQEINQRLNEIARQAKNIESSSSDDKERAMIAGHKTVLRSSRTGEFRQIGTKKKSRPSKSKS